ncbi:hypothetical protein QBC33DRAFT_581943 [Phialemonium atrogriseum]|uniref:Uncharacterized protein n=1 Tax=Phialemonium atrogriseum TaxID=1093897 RepID=A0AAJ0BPL7_9PEZI|nr:uncharacterized protein QBC33DRAFT_581943 [Phialemonium atrogriseum]KAK1762140.1 hypothetical protein QBC33DRAFT_581943 [Phialemonium atrogriseum]
MAKPQGAPPHIHLHSPAVDFIETRLPKYHPVFASENVMFCPETNRIRDATRWREVNEVLERARLEYNGRDDEWDHGLIGKFKRHGRSSGKLVAQPIQQIIKVLSSHSVATPVLGVVNLLMTYAWKEAAKVRDQVSTEIDKLGKGVLFANMRQYYETFKDDQNIINASVNLLLTIFKALEGAIGFYISQQGAEIPFLLSFHRLVKAAFRGDEYMTLLRESLIKIKTDSDNLENEASIPSDQEQESARSSQILHNSEIIRQGQQESNIMMIDAWNKILPVLGNYEQPPPPSPWTPQLLHDLVAAAHGLDKEDMDAVLDRAGTMPADDRGRAEHVVATRHFRHWMLRRDMARLLVHGDFDSPESVSPLSVLAKEEEEEDAAGPGLLMQSFIAQLLLQCPYTSPPTLPPNVSLDNLEAGDVDQLCIVFSLMARRLPASATLVVLVDGLMVYLRRQFRDDMDTVLDALLGLGDRDKDGAPRVRCSVKLLLMSPQPTRSRDLVKVFRSCGGLLSMEAMYDSGQGPGRSGVGGQLEMGLGGFVEGDEEDDEDDEEEDDDDDEVEEVG